MSFPTAELVKFQQPCSESSKLSSIVGYLKKESTVGILRYFCIAVFVMFLIAFIDFL